MLNHRRIGAGEALVHGFLGGGGYWRPVAEHFAGRAALPVPETVAWTAPDIDQPRRGQQ